MYMYMYSLTTYHKYNGKHTSQAIVENVDKCYNANKHKKLYTCI